GLAIRQIEVARSYSLALLDDIALDEWFTMPVGCQTHVAWQVGHIAMAEYGLCLFRQRGRAEVDLTLMTSSFRKQFSRGTIPEPDPAKNPAPAELRATLDKVHVQALKELPHLTPQQ